MGGGLIGLNVYLMKCDMWLACIVQQGWLLRYVRLIHILGHFGVWCFAVEDGGFCDGRLHGMGSCD